MQLGINVIHGVEDWSRFRPFVHEGLQVAPPFNGSWNARNYVDKLVPGTSYICAISDNGSVQGDYVVQVKAPAQAATRSSLQGSVTSLDNGIVRFGRDNAWMTLEVSSELRVADLAIVITKPNSKMTGTWNDKFKAAVAPFKSWRAMGMCGIDSRVAVAKRAEEFGGFARQPLRWNDISPEGIYGSEQGCNPALLFPPDIPTVWINMPVLIAADPYQRASWIAEAWRWSQHCEKVIVGVGNEVWANDTSIGQLALRYGGLLDRDPSVGRCHALLLLTKALKDDLQRAGLSKFEAVFEWQIGNRWPFIFENGHPVSPECRELTHAIGKVAIAPYIGRGLTSLTSLTLDQSITDEAAQVLAWVQLLHELGLGSDDLYVYETGFEFPHSVAQQWRANPVTVEAIPRWLTRLNECIGLNSHVMWFGLCENNQWGALQTLDNLNDPVWQAIANWGV